VVEARVIQVVSVRFVVRAAARRPGGRRSFADHERPAAARRGLDSDRERPAAARRPVVPRRGLSSDILQAERRWHAPADGGNLAAVSP
jgi:hypothetical protein